MKANRAIGAASPVSVLSLVALAGGILVTAGCEKARLNQQMLELCKKDGGVKVYESIALSPTDYEALYAGARRAASSTDKFGPAYRYVATIDYIVGRSGDDMSTHGRLLRSHEAIVRVSDGKVLGEAVSYRRGGGDLFTLGAAPSQSMCPEAVSELDQAVFLKAKE